MRAIYFIALNTYRELVRSKILYSVLFFAVILVLLSAFFGSVTIGDRVKVIKDFGLMSVSFFAVVMAVVAGSSLLHKELYKRTIFNILARPVERWQFLVGKFLGVFATIVLMIAAMGLGLSLFIFIFEGKIDWLLPLAYFYICLELMIISAAALFFSSVVVTSMLGGLFTFAIFIAGRSCEYVLQFADSAEATSKATGSFLAKAVYAILPHLNNLSIADKVVYGEAVSQGHIAWSVLYAFGYSGVLLVLASIVFKRREFNF